MNLSLKVLTHPLILGNIKTTGLIASYVRCHLMTIKYLELFFVSINFEITTLSTATCQIFNVFFAP